MPSVQKRGDKILQLRGTSSTSSAVQAIIDHARDWHTGTGGRWVSNGAVSQGEYGVPKGLVFSFPVTIDANGKAEVVRDLPLSER